MDWVHHDIKEFQLSISFDKLAGNIVKEGNLNITKFRPVFRVNPYSGCSEVWLKSRHQKQPALFFREGRSMFGVIEGGFPCGEVLGGCALDD